MTTRKKIKCSKCEKDAVIIENEIYYCGPCAVKQFVTKLHKRLRSKPHNNYSKDISKNK